MVTTGPPRWEPTRTTVTRGRSEAGRWGRLVELARSACRLDRRKQKQNNRNIRDRTQPSKAKRKRPRCWNSEPTYAEPGCTSANSELLELSCRCRWPGLAIQLTMPTRNGCFTAHHFEQREALGWPMGERMLLRSSSCGLTLQDLGAAANAGHFHFPGGSQRHHQRNRRSVSEKPVLQHPSGSGSRRCVEGSTSCG